MPEDLAGRVALARAWQRRLAEGGYAGLHWPRAHGGRDASPVEQLIFVEECVRAGAPSLAELGIGMSLVGPVLIRHGSDAQRRRFLPPILTADELWCQGFSEPGAGSDLAGIRTRAERRGDAWVVHGQKVWTSYAQIADWCILLVRTDPHAKRHRGLTLLLVDMRSPGITVRPLVEMTGAPWFNEVFFDGVVVPDENVVGAVDDGWSVAMTTLGHERTVSSPPLRLGEEVRAVLALALASEAATDPRWRQRLARAAIEAHVVRLMAYRQADALTRGARVGPEGSCLKLAWSEADQGLKALAADLAGPYGALAADEARATSRGRWQHELLWSRAATIYAGTSEVQRNVIAERVLGLPRA
jgi:alkylation response protein AidB-like acyl-CoA dehydrogenase